MIHRRQFLTGIAAAVGAAAADPGIAASKDSGESTTTTTAKAACCGQAPTSLVDFRYSPLQCQHVFCFADDPHKGVIGELGDLRYGHTRGGNQNGYFPDETVEFSLGGMGPTLEFGSGWRPLESRSFTPVWTARRPTSSHDVCHQSTRRRQSGQRNCRGAAPEQDGDSRLPGCETEHQARTRRPPIGRGQHGATGG